MTTMTITTVLVSDLRQYTYCPRIVYYYYCLPHIRPTTYKMESGKAAHEEEAGREQRRSLRSYHVEDGERHFDVRVEDETLGLCGKVDMVIRCAGEVIPVEYKNSPGRLGKHVLLQLAAYGLLLERQWTLPVHRGFIYFIPARRAREVALTPALKADVQRCIAEIQDMVAGERMPPPPSRRAKCEICEFHRFCNDVV